LVSTTRGSTTGCAGASLAFKEGKWGKRGKKTTREENIDDTHERHQPLAFSREAIKRTVVYYTLEPVRPKEGKKSRKIFRKTQNRRGMKIRGNWLPKMSLSALSKRGGKSPMALEGIDLV